MRKLIFALIAGIFMSTPGGAVTISTSPKVFRVAENAGEGYGKFMIEITEDGTFSYYTELGKFFRVDRPAEKAAKISRKLSVEELALLRSELDKLNIWAWEAKYINENIDGGTYWDVNIKYSDKTIISHGENDEPAGYDALILKLVTLSGDEELIKAYDN